MGNDKNNVLDGGGAEDYLFGGDGEDTYVVKKNEGCDIIDNFADDNSTDIVVFEGLYEKSKVKEDGYDISVFDDNSEICFKVRNYVRAEKNRHILFSSNDHVVFTVAEDRTGRFFKVPQMLDFNAANRSVCVDLSHKRKTIKCKNPTGFKSITTVSDSPFDDVIIGNDQSNILSCSGGFDRLRGGKASDTYVVKRTCKKCVINNYDSDEKSDLLFVEETLQNLKATKNKENLVIRSAQGQLNVEIEGWFNSSAHQHLGVRTSDGITLLINEKNGKLEPTEVTKDPGECQCKERVRFENMFTYDLSKNPWEKVVRFKLNSSSCSYRIYGNRLNNHLDPGPCSAFSEQYLSGGNGADTYVLKYGYGEFNVINNFAPDKIQDTLQLGLSFEDIQILFDNKYNVFWHQFKNPGH